MEPADDQLLIRITKEEKALWKSLARQKNLSLARLIRVVMQQLVNTNPVNISDEQPEPSTKVTIRLKRREERAVREAAKVAGLPSRQAWIVALIRARLLDVPTPSPKEIQALLDANAQLRGVGINLNQIAHAVNIDLNHIDRLTGRTLDQLRRQVKVEKDAVAKLVKATLYRWTKRVDEDDV